MQLLGLLGMYFDAVVVEVEKYLIFFRLAPAILCTKIRKLKKNLVKMLVYKNRDGSLQKKVYLILQPLRRREILPFSRIFLKFLQL